MANDRLYLACLGCAESLVLFKYYPTIARGYCPQREDEDDGTITTFIRQHLSSCHPRAGQFHLAGNPGFVVVTEQGNAIADAKHAIGDRLTNFLSRKDPDTNV